MTAHRPRVRLDRAVSVLLPAFLPWPQIATFHFIVDGRRLEPLLSVRDSRANIASGSLRQLAEGAGLSVASDHLGLFREYGFEQAVFEEITRLIDGYFDAQGHVPSGTYDAMQPPEGDAP